MKGKCAMKTDFTLEQAEQFFQVSQEENRVDQGCMMVAFDDASGAQAFAHGSVEALCVCIAAMTAHVAQFAGLKPGDILRQARKIIELKGSRTGKRVN